MADLLIHLAGSLLGATVGVIWPAKNPAWARRQKWGIALGVIALLSFGAAYVAAQFANLTHVVWPAVIVGLVALTGYGIIGNICRRFHELDAAEKR